MSVLSDQFEAYLDMVIEVSRGGRRLHPLQLLRDHYETKPVIRGVKKLKPKRCINNAVEMMCSGPLGRFRYMEGYAFVHIPIVHAWNEEIATGAWVDHTIRDPERWEYFGVHVSPAILLMANAHPMWIHSTGIFETLNFFSEEEMELVEEIFLQSIAARKPAICTPPDPIVDSFQQGGIQNGTH